MHKIKLLLGSLGFCLLVGCTPDYNWRELSVADDHAVLMFPSRIQTEQRSVQVEGLDLAYSLTSAAVDQAVFAVGFVPLSPTLEQAQVSRLQRAFVSALAARSGHPPPTQAFAGEVFEFETTVAAQPSWLMARVLIHRGMLLQVMVSGPKKSLSKESAVEFMRSLVLK